jgi:hypothetical protein
MVVVFYDDFAPSVIVVAAHASAPRPKQNREEEKGETMKRSCFGCCITTAIVLIICHLMARIILKTRKSLLSFGSSRGTNCFF